MGRTPAARFGRSARWLVAVPVATAGLLLGACTSSGAPGTPHVTVTQTRGESPSPVQSSSSTSAAPAPRAVITADLERTTNVNPATPITLTAKGGTIKSVTMLNPEGKKVTGAVSGDGRSWHTTEDLGYSKTYKLTATAANGDGVVTTKKLSLTTLTPSNMTLPYFNTVYGGVLQNGGTYGVGMIPVVHFDEVIPNRAAAEKALQVTTTPHVDGSWYWADAQTLHWRPKNFYASGTKVTIKAKVYGVDVGGGMYGQEDRSISFTIGRRQVTTATDTALSPGESGTPRVNKIRVYRDGKLIRTMNTSMGKHGGETVDGKYINFYTLDGTYTVLGFENPAHMCSDTYGLPASAPGGYGCENIPWSTKISTDGIYLHELDTTVWDQDNGYDVSHGCLNMNHDNAEWFYTHSLVGDPVIIHGAKGAPTLQLWQGGDWTMSWAQWQKGSALSS